MEQFRVDEANGRIKIAGENIKPDILEDLRRELTGEVTRVCVDNILEHSDVDVFVRETRMRGLVIEYIYPIANGKVCIGVGYNSPERNNGQPQDLYQSRRNLESNMSPNNRTARAIPEGVHIINNPQDLTPNQVGQLIQNMQVFGPWDEKGLEEVIDNPWTIAIDGNNNVVGSCYTDGAKIIDGIWQSDQLVEITEVNAKPVDGIKGIGRTVFADQLEQLRTNLPSPTTIRIEANADSSMPFVGYNRGFNPPNQSFLDSIQAPQVIPDSVYIKGQDGNRLRNLLVMTYDHKPSQSKSK